MEEITAKTWDEFKSAISGFRRRHGRRGTAKSTILFRGHENASWTLQTALERVADGRISLPAYLRLALEGKNEIETFSGHDWRLKSWKDVCAELRGDAASPVHLPAYAYLVYLRQHGFPSPLLDWSESPYVAAFFAFEARTAADAVAVYCYSEAPAGMKRVEREDAFIELQGPYVTADKRHFSQKASYTIAVRWDDARKEHFFTPHEDAFRNPKNQDFFLKITMPGALRREVLRELADYNITRFTLLHSEDALVQSLAMRAFDLADT